MGYLQGAPSEKPIVEKTTRTTYVAEIELGVSQQEKDIVAQYKADKAARKAAKVAAKKEKISKKSKAKGKVSEEGDLSVLEEKEDSVVIVGEQSVPKVTPTAKETTSKVKTYVVKSGDTLEKISARPEIYGDKKKWYKIFKANESKLKEPNRIYPGQVLDIPE
jgi:nucleoid-associated protein YgaU